MNSDSVEKKSAEIQITSEQLLQDAFSFRDAPLKRPKQSIQDLDELRSYQITKRKEFEQQLNKNRLNFGQWLRYARWEIDHNHDFSRARSIYERALEVNIQHIPFWTHYIQFELTNKNVNHARNILDRAVTTLPKIDKLWFLYVQTEESLRNYQMVRNVFERWLKWNPQKSAWDAYINFERRYDEYNNCRSIYTKWVQSSNDSMGEIWLKWLDFEINEIQINSVQIGRIRNVFELAVDSLLEQNLQLSESEQDVNLPIIISKWSIWEASVNETDRSRAIFHLLLSNDSKNGIKIFDKQREQIYNAYTDFEKIHGNRDTIESSILLKRKLKYKQDLLENPQDYDKWWALLNLLGSEPFHKNSNREEISLTYENAVGRAPNEASSKSTVWKRYIFLWIRYALFEEFELLNIESARSIWNRCIKVIPHEKFTFGKVWIHFAEFEIRNDEQNEVTKARKILGKSIGMTSTYKPKNKIFRYYIGLEKKLGEWERCRKLYEKWLESSILSKDVKDKSLDILLDSIEFEKLLNDFERVESLYNLGISLSETHEIKKLGKLETVDQLWISFIEFLKDEFNYAEARNLYEKLIERKDTVRSWVSFAFFESSILSPVQLKEFEAMGNTELEFSIDETHRENTRNVFRRAIHHYKELKSNENRLIILQEWKNYEATHGSTDSVKSVSDKFPTMVKKRITVNGTEEEHIEFIFPDDVETAKARDSGLNKFLANAKRWASTTES